jgi:hypothetical protein
LLDWVFTLRLDVSDFVACVRTLSAEIPQYPAEVVERAIAAGYPLAELACINVDTSTAAADEVIARLQPSERLLALVAAARAPNVDSLIVKETGHGELRLGREP